MVKLLPNKMKAQHTIADYCTHNPMIASSVLMTAIFYCYPLYCKETRLSAKAMDCPQSCTIFLTAWSFSAGKINFMLHIQRAERVWFIRKSVKSSGILVKDRQGKRTRQHKHASSSGEYCTGTKYLHIKCIKGSGLRGLRELWEL